MWFDLIKSYDCRAVAVIFVIHVLVKDVSGMMITASQKCSHYSKFVVFSCGSVPTNSIDIYQSYFTGIGEYESHVNLENYEQTTQTVWYFMGYILYCTSSYKNAFSRQVQRLLRPPQRDLQWSSVIDIVFTYLVTYITSRVWYEIIYPFPNFNGCTVEIWEYISFFIPYLINDVITYPCWYYRQSMLEKRST